MWHVACDTLHFYAFFDTALPQLAANLQADSRGVKGEAGGRGDVGEGCRKPAATNNVCNMRFRCQVASYDAASISLFLYLLPAPFLSAPFLVSSPPLSLSLSAFGKLWENSAASAAVAAAKLILHIATFDADADDDDDGGVSLPQTHYNDCANAAQYTTPPPRSTPMPYPLQ